MGVNRGERNREFGFARLLNVEEPKRPPFHPYGRNSRQHRGKLYALGRVAYSVYVGNLGH